MAKHPAHKAAKRPKPVEKFKSKPQPTPEKKPAKKKPEPPPAPPQAPEPEAPAETQPEPAPADEEPPVPAAQLAAAEKPKRKSGIDDNELVEFEDYFRRHEKDSSPYHVNISLMAGTNLLLVEILRALRKG